MKKWLLIATFTSILSAQEAERIRTQLCDFWRYDFHSQAYTCSFLSPFVKLVEAREHEQIVGRLEDRIAMLENKLERLEKLLEKE